MLLCDWLFLSFAQCFICRQSFLSFPHLPLLFLEFAPFFLILTILAHPHDSRVSFRCDSSYILDCSCSRGWCYDRRMAVNCCLTGRLILTLDRVVESSWRQKVTGGFSRNSILIWSHRGSMAVSRHGLALLYQTTTPPTRATLHSPQLLNDPISLSDSGRIMVSPGAKIFSYILLVCCTSESASATRNTPITHALTLFPFA